MSVTRNAENREYLEGLNHISVHIYDIQNSIEKLKCAFYNCSENDESVFMTYLRSCNEQFLECNNQLKRKNIQMQVIDSELRIIGFLNDLRTANGKQDTILFLTEFWEKIKESVDSFTTLSSKFTLLVLSKLQNTWIPQEDQDCLFASEFTKKYKVQMEQFWTEMSTFSVQLKSLLKGYTSGIQQELFCKLGASEFIDSLVVKCDVKAFPVLRLIPDSTRKLECLCELSRQYIERDKQYLKVIDTQIEESKTKTQNCKTTLQTKQIQQKKMVKNCKASKILLKSHSEKLQVLEQEIEHLQRIATQHELSKIGKAEEKTHKESMVDFLQISISQTKKNIALQLKRQRLIRQIRELETHLVETEQHITNIQNKQIEQSQEKAIITEKVDNSEKAYKNIKKDLNNFTEIINILQDELNRLHEKIDQLQILHNVKTSPEVIDGFYERPSSVKLSPSLIEKIKLLKVRKLDKRK